MPTPNGIARGILALTIGSLAATISPTFGQATAPAGAAPTVAPADEEPIVLSPFLTTGQREGRYQPTESMSGGRVRVNLFNAPQSVSVVTRELMEDTGTLRLLDALQYISGVTESTIPNGLDRVTIRGFQSDGQRVDNFASGSQANLDPIFIDRIEVVKGPNAVLAPSGVPGGTINAVTRKPQFRNFGSLSAEVGIYSSERAELDYNRVFGASNNMAFRVVGAAQDTEGYADDPKRVYAIMPMFTFRAKGGGELTAQAAYSDSTVQNWWGIPIDPSSGTNTEGKLLEGVDRFLNTDEHNYRFERRPEFRVLFTQPLTEQISMRLAARYTDYKVGFQQVFPSTTTRGGGVDPLTGNYTPGIVYGPAPDYAPSPAPPMPRILPRAGTRAHTAYSLFNVQNDYLYSFETDTFKGQTLVGGAFDRTFSDSETINNLKDPINYDAPAPSNVTLTELANRVDTTNYSVQAYVSQNLSFLDERLILNGGYSYNNYDLQSNDLLTNRQYNTSVDVNLLSYGVLVKPLPGVALYYSYSENSTPQSAFAVLAQNSPPLQDGEQDEFGLRVNLLENRLSASVAYFEILQNNYSVPNPANYVFPSPVPPLPALFSDRNAQGWEFELRASLTDSLSLIGNYTTFKNRDPLNIPFRGTAEESGALWASYEFLNGSRLKGLSIGVGVNYLAERPGDVAGGVTAASTEEHQIPVQPNFYLPARTLVNLNLGYKLDEHWRFQVNIDNLFDEEYLAASINRFVVVAGAPFNLRARVTYSF